jgi:hypothetical protein
MNRWLSIIVALFSLTFSLVAQAQVVTGMAYIENGNLVKAKESARREAMRSFVEKKIGVKVNSESETENFLLVRDRIVSKSEGFIVVKKVVSENNDGPYYTVVLDLEVGAKPIELAQADVKTMLSTLDRNSSRGSMDIAITSDSDQSTWDWSGQMVACLKEAGFGRIKRNDHILSFLDTNNNLQSNKLQLYSELRRIGRFEGTGAKSIVRGYVRNVKPASAIKNAYISTAQASIEIIGYDSSNVDALSKYATAVAKTPEEAELNAKKIVLEEAAQSLAEQAAITVQYEEQGGKREIETTFIFQDIYNKSLDSGNILAALEDANCEIDRSVFNSDGQFIVAVYTQEYSKLNDLVREVLRQLATTYPNSSNSISEDIGTTKTIIRLGAR